MFGLMQDRPLLISSLLRHAAVFNAQRKVVSWDSGVVSRRGFSEAEVRARAGWPRPSAPGICPGDRVASLAWNTYRHMELFYGAPGVGAVLHTLNPRLWKEQLVYIIGHAEDRVLFFDPDQLDLVTRLAPLLSSVERYVLLGGDDALPATSGLPLVSYEQSLLADDDFAWPEFDERQARIS